MKNTLILAVLLFSIKTITAQDTKSYYQKEAIIFLGPSYTNIRSNSLSSDQYANTQGSVWFNLGFSYCKYANKNIGFILGAEYSKYKNVTSYKGAYRKDTKSLDADGYFYYAVSEANYTDTRILNSLDVPLGIRLNTNISEQSFFYLDFGVMGNFILTSKIVQKGTLNKKGAYPHNVYDNVFFYIEDEPYYGFTNTTYNTDIEMPVNRVNASVFLGVGLKAKLNENCFLVINPCYTKGINDITKKDATGDYVNIFGEKTARQKFTLSQFVLKVGLGFEL